MTVRIERHYAITLAERGVEDFKQRIRDTIEQDVQRLIHNGIPIFLFIKRRFTRHEAEQYVRQHPSAAIAYLRLKEKEYREFVDVFKKERETFIELEMHVARKLIRYERNNDDAGDYVYT